MPRQIINTTTAPQAFGTYSQAVRVGNAVYISGQIPIDPATGELTGGDIEEQIRRVFDNLQAIARAVGADLNAAAKITVFLTNLEHFPLLNQIMAQYWHEPYPARSTIGVASLPRGAQVEIECVLELS